MYTEEDWVVAAPRAMPTGGADVGVSRTAPPTCMLGRSGGTAVTANVVAHPTNAAVLGLYAPHFRRHVGGVVRYQ